MNRRVADAGAKSRHRKSSIDRLQDTTVAQQSLDALASGPLHWFRDWPNRDVPAVCAGVYTVWLEETLIYVGMSGRSLTQEAILERRASKRGNYGLFKRLRSHSRGRRSGDQFCVYVADRFVLPSLSVDDIKQISEGHRKLDAMVRVYIHANLAYRFVEVSCGAAAFELEDRVQRGALAAGKPRLNPKNR